MITLAFWVFAQPAAAQTYRFNAVSIEGNQRIEPQAIIGYAGIARGEQVSGARLNEAYQRILASGLFETVEIEPRGGTLVIRVQEYPTINRLRFEGNRRIKDDVLESIVQSRPRFVFNPAVAEADAAAIAEAYVQQGRLAARVTPRIIRRSDNRVDLVYEVFEGGVVEIERISFVGNRAFSDRRLRRVLETKQATLLRAFIGRDTFIADRIEFDRQVLSDFYQSRGYVDIRVTGVNAELVRERDRYFVTFNVEEGQRFTFGNITTTSELSYADADEFNEVLRIRPGVVYSPALVENSISRMERLALRKGLDFVRVEPRITRNDRDLTLDVEFVLTRGPRVFVERIDIEGNATTLDRVVRRQFRTVEGDPFNPREIRESAERIRALGFFDKADVNARQGTAPDQVVIDVDLEEKPTGSLAFGGTYSTSNGFGLVISFEEANFLGRGQSLKLSVGGASETRNYELRFTEPAFLGRDLEFGVAVAIQDFDFNDVRYDSSLELFNPRLTFNTGEFTDMTLNYLLRNTDMTVSAAEARAGALIDGEAARGELLESSLGYQLRYDSRRSGLNPNAGVLLEIGQQFAGLGGDIDYITTRARAVGETKVANEEVTLRLSLEGGALYAPNNNSRVTDRFFIGSNTLRGFEPRGVGPREVCAAGCGTATFNDALGGKYFAVARLEAEFPLGLPDEYGLSGGLFYDIGSVWGVDGTPTIAGSSLVATGSSWRHVIGFSLFWDTPVGPLRFNFSRALQSEPTDVEQTFNFTLRTNF